MSKISKITQNLITTGYTIIILSFFGNYFYFFDLFSHFYLQYFFIGIILLITSILIKEKLLILLCTLMVSFLGFNIGKATIINKEYTGSVDYYYLNANYNIDSPELIAENIKKYNPKYVVIVELNENLHDIIKEELGYKNIVYHSEGISSFGFFTNEEIEKQVIHNLTFPVGEIKVGDTTVFVVHPFPPMSSELASMQKSHFLEVKALFDENSDEDKMIIGDFNSSFYSSVFKKYFGEMYHKPIYSWLNTGILRIPIDYALGNSEFFEIYGVDLDVSDHSPLIIKLKD